MAIDIEFTASGRCSVEPTRYPSTTVSVIAERVDITTLLDNLTLPQIIDHYGEESILNHIGEDTVKNHFNINNTL